MMTFERKLFEEVREVFPTTTARTFSRDCGMSDGYYGSITAQRLPISTNALIYLAEVLIYRTDAANNITADRANKLDDIQEMIAEEIARRTKSIDSENLVVRKKLLTALARTVNSRDPVYWVPPLIVG